LYFSFYLVQFIGGLLLLGIPWPEMYTDSSPPEEVGLAEDSASAAGAVLLFRRLRRMRKRMQTRMRKMRRLATPPNKVSRVTVSNPGLTRAFGLGLLSATCRRGAEE
jgi:hypothetical protein